MPETTFKVGETPLPEDPSIPPRMEDRKPDEAPAPEEEIREAVDEATSRGHVFGYAFGANRPTELDGLFAKVQRPLSEIAESVKLPSDYPMEVRQVEIKSHPMASIEVPLTKRITRRPYSMQDLQKAYDAALAAVRSRVQAKAGDYVTCFYDACARAIQDGFFIKASLPTDERLTPQLRGTADRYTTEKLALNLGVESAAQQPAGGLAPNLIKGGVLGQDSSMTKFEKSEIHYLKDKFTDWNFPIGLNRDERAVTFETVGERDRAIDLIFDESEALFRVPYEVADGTTLVFPAEAVPLLAAKGLKFQDSKVRLA